MASPQKRSRYVPAPTPHRVAETSLPLHLALAWLAVRTLPFIGPGTESVYSATFIAAILEIISGVILEIEDEPATYASLLQRTDPLIRDEVSVVASENARLRGRGANVSLERRDAEVYSSWMQDFANNFSDVADGCAFIDFIEAQVREKVNETDDFDPSELREPIERHSLLGVFLRGLMITLRKISFDETTHLSKQVGQWCGTASEGSSVHIFSLNRRHAVEDSLDTRVKAMQEYRCAEDTGDYSKALVSLRRFYDYQSPSPGQNQHQHALLNLATFHYSTGGTASARAAVEEAIRIARAEGDRACLQHCMSLLKRINMEETVAFGRHQTPRIVDGPIPASRLSTATTPMEELWNMKAALDLGEPVHMAMRRVHAALARYEQTSTKHGMRDTKDSWASKHEFDLAAWHAAQASLWDMMGKFTIASALRPGCDSLASVHEELALDQVASDSDARLTVMFAKAERASRNASFDQALAILLDHTTSDGLTLSEYHRWSRAVWAILERKAKLSDDAVSLELIDNLRPSSDLSTRAGPGAPTTELGQAVPDEPRRGIVLAQEHIRESLRKARKMHDANTPAQLVLPLVLSAVHLSSGLSLWAVYRYGVVLLASVLLSMEGAGMASKAKAELEKVWDQVKRGSDEEVKALANLAMGKSEVELALQAQDSGRLDTARPYLETALSHARSLGARSMILQSTTLLSLIDDVQDKQGDREERARQWQLAKEGDERKLLADREEVRRVGQVVRDVGRKAAMGWR